MDFKKLEAKCKANGITEVEIYKYTEEGTSITTFNGQVDDNKIYEKNENYIRGVYNGHIVALYVENDTDEEIDLIVERIKENALITESTDPYFIYGGSKEYPVVESCDHDYDNYSQADKIGLCKKLEAFVREKCEFVQMSQSAIYVSSETLSIVNSNGLNVSRSDVGAAITVGAVVRKDGDVKQGYSVQYVKNFADIDYDKILKECIERPVSSIGAKSIESGHYPVVFENKAAAGLIGCFLSMFSAEAVIKKISLLADKVGQKVFGDNITFVDDPLNEKAINKYPFDDEGVAAFPKTVVENGVLKTYLHNLSTAKMLDAQSTGNGFKEGSGSIGVSPTNFCLKSGEKSFDEMISTIENGVFITDLMGMHSGVNAVSGAFNLQSSGYKIENGKLTDPVTLIIVSGNIIDMLNNVVEVSNDFECSRRVGSGSVYVKSLAVSGK